MKVLLITSIYPPDIGGPATYCFNLEKNLREKGIVVEVVVQSRIKSRFGFFLKILQEAEKADLLYVFNLVSCGLPACLVAVILRKKLVGRSGGDYLWERAIEAGKTSLSLKEFHQGKLSIKEKVLKFAQKLVLRKISKMIFTTDLQKDIYLEHFALKRKKAVVLANPFPQIFLPSETPQIFTMVYAGRLIKFKNLDFVLSVLAEIEKPFLFKIIGAGPQKEFLQKRAIELGIAGKIVFISPLNKENLWLEIAKSSLSVLIAKTSVSPNFILESLALNKPVLLTKEVGFKKEILENIILVDPNDKKCLKEKILFLMDKDNYQAYSEKIKKIDKSWGWREITGEHINIFKSL